MALCDKCVKKLMWKRQKEKGKEMEREKATGLDLQTITGDTGARDVSEDPLAKRRKKKSRDKIPETRRRRSSRSHSPRRSHIPLGRPHSVPRKSDD